MDILTHTISGLAVGTVLASFASGKYVNKIGIVCTSGLASILPDLDAISLWSGFDSTFGKFFHLNMAGKDIYSSKLWYAHHAFFHSIFAAVFFAFVLGVLIYLIDKLLVHSELNFKSTLKSKKLLLISFVFGYSVHLLEDMPTPSSTWGGVRLLWPMKSYFGGSGQIWWWNNYDIFLIVSILLIVNLLLFAFKRYFRFEIRKLIVGLFMAACCLILYQINTRKVDFSYHKHTTKYIEYERKSKVIQHEILGDRIFNFMESFDKRLKIYF